MQKGSPKKPIRKPQHQPKPGIEKKMMPRPIYDDPADQELINYRERLP